MTGNLVKLTEMRVDGKSPDGTTRPGSDLAFIVKFDPVGAGCNDLKYCNPGAIIEWYENGTFVTTGVATGYNGSLGEYAVSYHAIAPQSGSITVTAKSLNKITWTISVSAIPTGGTSCMSPSACRQSNNTQLGTCNDPKLIAISPAYTDRNIVGSSPLITTMRISVDASFGIPSGWCISWGDGEQNIGVFGSVGMDGEFSASATHTYRNTESFESHYYSMSYKPWATITTKVGNFTSDFKGYINVCRSDAIPDKIGGCGYPPEEELPPLEPPKTVCTAGNTTCVGTAGFLCDWEGVWTFDPTITTQCMRDFDPIVGFPTTCVENNVECRSTAMYKCVNGVYAPTGEACGVTAEPVKDSHGCITSEGYAWCPVLTRCVKPEITPCIGGVVIPETPASETPVQTGGTEIPMQTIMIIGAVILGALLISGGGKKS